METLKQKQEEQINEIRTETAAILGKAVRKNLTDAGTKLNEASKTIQAEARQLAADSGKSISKRDVAMWVSCFFLGVVLMFFVQRFFFTDLTDYYFNKAVNARVEQVLQEKGNQPR
jgi:hypothetical protein